MGTHLELQKGDMHAELFICNYTKNILFTTHQCVHFANKPMQVHKLAVKQIIHYLKSTCMKGYIIHLAAENDLTVTSMLTLQACGTQKTHLIQTMSNHILATSLLL